MISGPASAVYAVPIPTGKPAWDTAQLTPAALSIVDELFGDNVSSVHLPGYVAYAVGHPSYSWSAQNGE